MLCQASWIPAAVAGTLRDHRSAQPLIAWLGSLRADAEEYDPLVTVRPPERSRSPSPAPSPHSEPDAASPDSAFDEILSQIGKEIYKLEQYQRNLVPEEKDEISRSVLNLFDKCLEYLSDNNSENNSDLDACDSTEVTEMKPAENGVADIDSDCESTLSDISIVTSTPADCEKVMPTRFNKGAPAPPPRARLKTPSSSSSPYEKVDIKTNDTLTEAAKRLCLTDSDSESTCWRYKDCSADENEPDAPTYSSVWCHSSGYNNSDRILRDLLAQNHATVSRISFDTASDFSPSEYTVYSLHEVGGDRCGAVADMAPGRPADDGYEPVRTNVENDYEEIGFGTSYTDEGYSCEGSIEVESCSISASSECGRESPLYVNLKDHAAYTLSSDVLYWRNLLWDPFYNDDEEDEWITPEECAVYSREQRPPLVIPRITQYRPIHQSRLQPAYAEEPQDPPLVKSSPRNYERLNEWSPTSEKSRAEMDRSFSKANSDSPPFTRLNKRFGGSTENLLGNIRRPTHLNLPASSSGDSLDVEVRDHKEPGYARSRKSRSMVAPKHRMLSPVPVPRTLMPTHAEAAVLSEGPVKRTKFSESGKKCRKNWADCYMVLTPTALIFYKDERTYQASKVPRPPGTPPSPTAPRAELVLPLRNAHVMQCIQNHTRRYTRSIVLTVGYDQYLLQDDCEEGARRWMKNIQNVYYKLGPPRGDDYPLHSQSSNTDLESLGRTPPVSRHSNRSHKAGGSSNEDLSDSTEVSIPKVKRTLRNFFAKRPTMDSLVKKGIYQEEPVFGRKLDEVCPTASPRVPDFVVACVKEIESSEENMCTDGLYRASGNLSQVQKIRLEVDQSKLSVLETSADIHVLTGSLKLFFRELKEPLIPCSIFDRVLAACSIKPREAKIKEFRDIVNALPQCNRETLKFLLEHLLRVTKYSERNRMHTANLAIVFGPTLLWAPAEQAHNIAIDCIQQNHVVEILLNEFKEIFDDGKAKKKT